MPPETAIAVPEETTTALTPQQRMVAQIDDHMPQIAEMLPDGMDAQRFRRVVVQALVRNPELWECTRVSVVSAIVEAAQLGLEPTGVLGRAWLLPYRNKGQKEAKLIPGYRGYAELAWRADKIILKAEAVRAGDEFSYSEGMGADHFLRHVPNLDDPDREASDDNITFVYAVYTLADGRQDFAVMSRKAVEKVRARARYDNPVWASDFGEMAKKTVLRRLLKITPLSPQVADVLGRDEAVDFDTPVARVADEKASAARERITQRTEAIRAGKQEQPGPDVWFREIHALGNKRGVDHDRLHDWAVKKFGVQSMKDLTPSQRADMTLALEKLPVIESASDGRASDATSQESESVPASKGGAKAGGSNAGQAPTPPAAIEQPESVPTSPVDPEPGFSPRSGSGTDTSDGAVLSVESGQPAPSGDLTLEAVLEASGGIDVTDMPEHGTAEYREWFAQQSREKRSQLRAQGLGPSDKPKARTAPDPEPLEVAS